VFRGPQERLARRVLPVHERVA